MEPGGPPRSFGVTGWARWAWRQLTSMRTALILLFLLALAAVPGSFFPQRGVDPGEVVRFRREHPSLTPWVERAGLFDVYASPWFSAIYLLLFVSLTGCVLPRARQHLRAVRARPPAPPRHLSRLPVSRSYATALAPDQALAAARAVLRRRHFRVDPAPGALSAEKGQLRETGNLVFHLSLLLVLVAVATGHFYGYAANVVVAEGRGFANAVAQYDTFEAGARVTEGGLPPFSVVLDRLDVSYEQQGGQRGAPREFTAHVRYRTAPDAPHQSARIAPNSPLVVDGTKVFLLGNGYAPRFTVRDARGDVVLQGPVPLLPVEGEPNMVSNGVLKVPDAAPADLGLTVSFLPTAAYAPFLGRLTSAFPDARVPRVLVTGAWQGDLGLDSGETQSVYRLDSSRMTPLEVDGVPVTAELAPGETLRLPEGRGSVTFDGVARFASFQVAADPGGRLALAGAVLALAGLLASLFVPRRRVWVRATAGPAGRTVVEVGALARGDAEGLGDEVDTMLASLQESVPPEGATKEQAWTTSSSHR
ncbi:MAG: cytochrome c biogenesis protein ResB [Actinomycetota bacterium]|nr:cytochrome c biogenesis protein ResB [Actinomycetota bacterium]